MDGTAARAYRREAHHTSTKPTLLAPSEYSLTEQPTNHTAPAAHHGLIFASRKVGERQTLAEEQTARRPAHHHLWLGGWLWVRSNLPSRWPLLASRHRY
jgi:hypothetical protein